MIFLYRTQLTLNREKQETQLWVSCVIWLYLLLWIRRFLVHTLAGAFLWGVWMFSPEWTTIHSMNAWLNVTCSLKYFEWSVRLQKCYMNMKWFQWMLVSIKWKQNDKSSHQTHHIKYPERILLSCFNWYLKCCQSKMLSHRGSTS